MLKCFFFAGCRPVRMRVPPSDVCKQPLRHLNLQLSDTEGTRHGGFKLLDSIMQHEPTRTSSVLHLSGGGPSLTSTKRTEPQNFAESLPSEMSVRIFSELDPESLCSAACACKLWHHLIEDSEQLWRTQCLLVRAVCQREVDRDRRHGLSWKVTLVRNYTRSCLKSDWLRGRYSHVRSAEELSGRRMTPLDAETWGEILEAELDR
ncbi:F-box only protein 48 isoform X2 [Platichthys flesus]|uniref:F-box only protein 48 isoform X2 n=1 Tax=Platichthys flesus TaxID=8260 RepID=UPI002DB70330|nr:F-box only protein 48 isoform X2 [Platichthys flesus]